MKLIILDRDGVINEDSDDYIKSAEEWQPVTGSMEAIARLHQAGYTIAVATNQSGVGRGLFTLATLEKIHNKMTSLVKQVGGEITAIFFCPHTPEDNCNCRKPKPGLLQQIEKHFSCRVTAAPFVGDSFKDLQLARIGHCKPILVKSGKGRRTLSNYAEQLNDIAIFENLYAYTESLLKGQ